MVQLNLQIKVASDFIVKALERYIEKLMSVCEKVLTLSKPLPILKENIQLLCVL